MESIYCFHCRVVHLHRLKVFKSILPWLFSFGMLRIYECSKCGALTERQIYKGDK